MAALLAQGVPAKCRVRDKGPPSAVAIIRLPTNKEASMMSGWTPMAGWRRWAAAAILGLLAGCGGGDGGGALLADISATALVQTQAGPVAAVQQNGMFAYRRIPYAAPPTGARRWQAPADAQPWTTAIRSDTSANTCPQASTSPFVIPSTNEDCLY